MPDHSPPSPTLPTSAAAPADTHGPSFTSHHSPEYVHASSREITGVMDAVCSRQHRIRGWIELRPL